MSRASRAANAENAAGLYVSPPRSPPAVVGRAAAPRDRRDRVGQPAGVLQGPAQHHLDLGVHAAQLVGGPAGERVVDRGVDAEDELLALARHEYRVPAFTIGDAG